MAQLQSYYGGPSLFQYSFHISLDPKFIYVNNAECGCSTTKASLNRWHAAWHGDTIAYSSLGEIHSRGFNRLLTPNQLGPDATNTILNDPTFYRFTLLRDPVSRLASAYQNKLTWDTAERQLVNRLVGRSPDETLTFADFLSLIKADKAVRDVNEHWRSQTLQIAAPLMEYDQFCLFGTLDRDLLAIRDRLFPGVALDVFETLKQFPQNRSGSERLLAAINTEQLESIAEVYAEDFAFYDKIVASRPPQERPPNPMIAAAGAAHLTRILHRFESLGDNCEFGFVQRAYGIDTGGLLRWSFAEFPSLIGALQADFRDLVQYPNLVPYTNDMVRDIRSGICVHSQMKSNGTTFLADDQVRQQIFTGELVKIDHMTKKLQARMRDPSVILVYKRNRNLSDAEIQALSDALAPFGPAQLLVVRRGDNPGTVKRMSDRLMIGVVDRFAPYNSAYDSSLDVWGQIVQAADALCPDRVAA